MQTATDVIEKAKGARGRKDVDKEDGATIKLKPLKDALRELGELALKAKEANAKVKDAIKAVAEKSGLLSSVVRRLVKALSGDSDQFEDEKRKVEQLGIVFEEIGHEGEITKATTKN
jgi:hypothetical protein